MMLKVGGNMEGLMTTLEEKVNPEHAAVLVIDIQNDFCHEDGYLHKLGLDISATQAMVPRLVGFIDEARKANVKIIFVQGIYNNRYLSGPFVEKDRKHGLNNERCLEGSWGADFYKVTPRPNESVIRKHRYSPFVGTELDRILQEAGIKSLILTGVTTNVCVESTARDGFMRDYYIVFLSDCTATFSQDVHETTLGNITRHFGTVATSPEAIRVWHGYSGALPQTGTGTA
jgi:ureidoacrylate peracid hydrolase